MKTRHTIRLLLCLLCGLLGFIDVQAQVQITSHVVPPYLNRIQDYASQPHLMVVTLTNTSTSEVQVQLTANITGDNGISAWVKPGYRSPNPIVIQPGQTINLNGNDIAFLFDVNKIEYTGISRADMTRGLGLLEGNYTFCIRALQYQTLQPISPEQTGCTTIRITDLEPPRILSPFNAQVLDTKGVQAVPITWTTPPGSSPFTEYKVKLVEMMTDRNPNDAIQSTMPLLEITVNSNMLLYGPAHPPLVKGRKYAMMVQAQDPTGRSNFRNRGISEPITFVYGEEEPENYIGVAETDSVLRYATTVRGRLVYRFPESPESGLFPIANQQVYLEKVYGTYAMEGGRSIFTPVPRTLTSFAREIMDSKRVTTDAEGNFELTADFLEGDSSGMVSAEHWHKLTAERPVTSAAKLRHLQTLKGNLAVTYRIVVDNPYFNSTDNYMNIKPGGVWGLVDSVTNADMVLDANSFTLGVNVRETFNDMKGGYSGNQEIRIYRRTTDKDNPNLGIPVYEGDLLTAGTQPTASGTNVLIASRKTPNPENNSENPADHTVYFPRLFRSPGGSGHEYHICLVRGGVVVKDIKYDDVKKMTTPVGVALPTNASLTKQTANIQQTLTGPQTIATAASPAKAALQLPQNSLAQAVLKNTPTITKTTTIGSSSTNSGFNFIDVDAKQPMGTTLAGLRFNDVQKEGNSATRATQDKWQAYRYNSRPDTAMLTLERELVAAPRSKLTGKLMYAYKNKPGVPQQPYANMRLKLMVFYLSHETPASNNSNSQNSGREYTAQLGNYAGISAMQSPRYGNVIAALANQDNTQSKTSGGANQMIATMYMPFELYKRESRRISVNGVDVTDNGKILKTTTTDANGNFTFDFDNSDSTRLILEGATLSSGHGDLYYGVKGKVQRVYRIVPDVPYYCAPDDDVSVQPWEDKDAGTLVSYVNTYNLEVEVGQLVSDGSIHNSTIAMPDVNVQLLRPPFDQHASQLPNLPEVDINRNVNLSGSSGNNTTTSNANGMFIMTYYVPHLLKREAMTKLEGNRSVVVFEDVVVGRRGANDNYYIFADTSNRLSNRYFDATGMQYPKTHTNLYTREELNAPPVFAESPETAAYEGLAGYTFNSELDPNRVAKAKLRVKSKGSMISGRVMDEFTQLGLAGVTVTVNESVGSPNGSTNIQFDVVTDANGYFNFTEYSRYLESYDREYAATGGITNEEAYNWRKGANTYGYNTTMTIHAPGYEAYERDFGSEIGGDIRFGYKFHDDYVLKPAASNSFGYVVDAEHPRQGVTARVKLKINGRWVDTYSYNGDPNKARPSGSSGNYLLDRGYMSHSIGNYLESVTKAASTAQQPQQNTMSQAKSGISVTTTKATSTVTIDRAAPGFSPMYTELVKGYIENNNTDPARPKYTVVETGAAKSISRDVAVGLTDRIVSIGTGTTSSGLTLTGTYDRQRFDIDLPARPDSIIVMPFDPAYMTATFAVSATEVGQNLGEFKLQRRKHRVNVVVKTETGELVKGAKVAIDGSGLERTSGQQGDASFTFVNNSTENFTIRVFNAGPSSEQSVWIEPMTKPLTSIDNNKVQNVVVTVKQALLAHGRVTFATDGSPVSGAIVYVNQGTGSGSDMQTLTSEDGSFALVIPQAQRSGVMPARRIIPIKTAYNEEGKTFIGSQVDLMVGNTAPTEELALTVREVEGIDLSRLHGIPFRVSKLDTLDNGQYRVDGELYDIPGNANFAVRAVSGAHQVLQLRNAIIRPSTIRNAYGVPYAVVVDDDGEQSVETVNREFHIKAYDVFNATLEGYAGGTINLIGGDSDTSGYISGHVRIVDNSFNFPTSYMTIANQDFYLGNYGAPYNQLMKYYIPVFKTTNYTRTRFAIHSVQNEIPKPITFKYLGFDGLTETLGERESFLEGDSIVLYMKLSTKIQNNIPLEFSGGTAVIKHDRLSQIITNEPVRFALENWHVTSDSWTLSSQSGGIVLNKGTLQTGKLDLSFTNMQITPGELICNSLEKGTGLRNNIRIGGEVGHPLNVASSTEILFLYDPDVGKTAGKGHYKLTLTNASGTAATIENLDGMTRSSESIAIQHVSLLSNGEELFTFSPQQQPITFYNQIAFTPTNLVSYEDRLILTGTSNLFIRGLSDRLMSEFAFFKDSSNPKGHRIEIRPFRNFTFTGAGGTKFKALNQQQAFQFTDQGYGIAGTVELPSGGTLSGNLLSMATSALGSAAADAVKKQAEIIIGSGLVEDAAGNFAGKVGDELSGTIADARDHLLNGLNEVNNTYNQIMKIGQSGQQIVNEIAGKWRLAGQGLNAINNFSNDPVGSLLQMNGVFEGFTGIDLKKEASQKARLVAQSAIKGFQEQFPVSNMMPSTGNAGALKDGFAGMKFDFDMNAGRITGSLNIKKLEFGAAALSNVGIEMLMDRQGWYFYAGTEINVRSVPLIFPVSAGLLIGHYPSISPELKNRVLSTAYVKRLPDIWEHNKQPFSGFFFTGGKDIIPETKVAINLAILDFEVGAHAGFDARLYAQFGRDVTEIGVGAMLFANLYARLSVAMGLAGVEGSITAELAGSGRFRIINGDVSAALQACASVTIRGRAWVGPKEASYSEGIGALLTIDSGRRPVTDFSIKLGSQNCSQNPAFDY